MDAPDQLHRALTRAPRDRMAGEACLAVELGELLREFLIDVPGSQEATGELGGGLGRVARQAGGGSRVLARYPAAHHDVARLTLAQGCRSRVLRRGLEQPAGG